MRQQIAVRFALSHFAVMNVACVPMPDPVLGEKTCAFVILKAGRSLTLPELTAFLAEKGLAKFKLPERLELTDDLPLSKFGKVAKNVLTRQVAEKLSAMRTAEFFAERRSRADFPAFDRLMRRDGGDQPGPDDTIT